MRIVPHHRVGLLNALLHHNGDLVAGGRHGRLLLRRKLLVSGQMLLQLLLRVEGKAALNTLEGLLNVVALLHVADEVGFLAEGGVANLALKLLDVVVHRTHMLVHAVLAGGLVGALVTLVGTLLGVHRDDMLLQVGLLTELGSTVRTGEGLLLPVDQSHMFVEEALGA